MVKPFSSALDTVISVLAGIWNGDDLLAAQGVTESRLKICQNCTSFDSKSKRCEICLCYMNIKAVLAKTRCLDGKWGFMITMKEALCGSKLEDQSDEIKVNLKTLLERVNKVRAAWGKPMIVTSGLRAIDDHLRIYKEKAQRAGVKFDQSKVPMKSKHLNGTALDVSDPKLELTNWLKANPKILEDAGLWCEEGNSNWVHFQSLPFGSYRSGGTRWFNP